MQIPGVVERLVVPQVSTLHPEAGYLQRLRWVCVHGDVAGSVPPQLRILAATRRHVHRRHVCGDRRGIKHGGKMRQRGRTQQQLLQLSAESSMWVLHRLRSESPKLLKQQRFPIHLKKLELKGNQFPLRKRHIKEQRNKNSFQERPLLALVGNSRE